jgi:hypothetical protein
MKQPHDASKGSAVTATLRKRWLAGIAAAGCAERNVRPRPECVRTCRRMAGQDAQGVALSPTTGVGIGEKRMAQRVERVFADVGASDEQKARARAIVQASMAEMKALRPANWRRNGGDAHLAVGGNDRSRPHRAASRRPPRPEAEQMSKLMTRTLADLAEVLTPAQRSEAAKSLTRMGGGSSRQTPSRPAWPRWRPEQLIRPSRHRTASPVRRRGRRRA